MRLRDARENRGVIDWYLAASLQISIVARQSSLAAEREAFRDRLVRRIVNAGDVSVHLLQKKAKTITFRPRFVQESAGHFGRKWAAQLRRLGIVANGNFCGSIENQ